MSTLRLTFWPRFYIFRNYSRNLVENKKLGSVPFSTSFRCASCWHSHSSSFYCSSLKTDRRCRNKDMLNWGFWKWMNVYAHVQELAACVPIGVRCNVCMCIIPFDLGLFVRADSNYNEMRAPTIIACFVSAWCWGRWVGRSIRFWLWWGVVGVWCLGCHETYVLCTCTGYFNRLLPPYLWSLSFPWHILLLHFTPRVYMRGHTGPF